ncbi:MAG: ATP synthase subunit I [Erysipelotrichaceae bacterium]|nr:ATP synthase subunit I [Erysipelotrichaceae bacterium]
MNKKELIVSAVISLISALGMLFVDFRISTGIVLGFSFSILHLFLLARSVDGILTGKKGNFLFVLISSLFRYAVIALPLIIALLYSDYFNVFGAVAGFLVYKLVLVMFAVINKEQ